MSDASALYARLQLRPDATEKDIRRAYACELRKIDQATQPQAFQELRETYDQLLWRLRQSQKQASHAPEPAETQVHESVAPTRASTETSNGAEPVARMVAGEAVKFADDESHARIAEAEKLARECLEEIVAHMERGSFDRQEDFQSFLVRCLEDHRLATVDARQYFEWGIASILASGWRSRHELLFPPAKEVFGWDTDRSRLLWLGRPGQIVDSAIGELAVFDSQSSEHRALQKTVIRALRLDDRPKPGELVRALPVAEYVLAAFPHWLHVISQPNTVAKWREWETAMPGWRRKLVKIRRPRLVKLPPVHRDNTRANYWGWGFMFLLLLGGLSKLTTPDPQPVPRPPLRGSVVGTPLWEAQQAMRGPAVDSKSWRPAAPAVFPEMEASKNKIFMESSNAVASDGPMQARRRALEVGRGKPSTERCREVALIAHGSPVQHKAGEFGGRFDELLLQCTARRLATFSPAAVDQSADRQQQQAEQELASMRRQAEKAVPTLSIKQLATTPKSSGESWPPQPVPMPSPYSLAAPSATKLELDPSSTVDRYSIPHVTLMPPDRK